MAERKGKKLADGHPRCVSTDGLGNRIFGRLDQDGLVSVHYYKDGEDVTRIDANVYPVGSDLSARYEHVSGITLTSEDAEKIHLDMEE